MPALKVQPNGAVLKWARENKRKSPEEVAEKLGIELDTLVSWEAGKESVPLSKLKDLARVYKFALATFFLPEVPAQKLINPKFRTFDNVEARNLSEQTIEAYRKARRNQRLYLNLLEESGEEYKFNFPHTSFRSNPETFAIDIRKFLEVPDGIHLKLRDKGAALKYWISSLEKHGLLVFQFTLLERGFSLETENELPRVMVLSSSEYEGGRIFTIFHELAHILIKDSKDASYAQLEKFCNHFAGAFLVPQNRLFKSTNFVDYLKEFKDHWLVLLAGEFKVSQDVILGRLLNFKKITPEFYGMKIQTLRENYEKIRQLKRTKESDGFPAPARKTVMNTGLAVSKKFFSAYENGVINTTELVQYLDTTSHTLGNIRKEIDVAGTIRFTE